VSDVDVRLRRCFAAAFPELPESEVDNASTDTVAEWDSLASVTLVALVEEEFGVEIADLDLPDLRSYGAIRDYLRRSGA
jgi:acyl carrier protein